MNPGTKPGMKRYHGLAIGLHWLVALLIFVTFPLGLYMADLPLSPEKLKLYSWHKSIGVTVFALGAARLLWRVAHRPPPLPEMPAWQRRASQATHHLLYLLMLAVPVSGWLMSSAKGFQTVWFGVLPLPDLLPRDQNLGDALATLHFSFNLALAALVLLHLAAVARHQFIDRDGLLGRMLPRGPGRHSA